MKTMKPDVGASADEVADSVILTGLRSQVESLTAERDRYKKQLAASRTENELLSAVSGANEDIAEASSKAAAVYENAFTAAGVDIDELKDLAELRFDSDPHSALAAFPEELVATFAGLDPEWPRLAELVLSELRPGSVAVLEAYGICEFTPGGKIGRETSDVKGKEVRQVILSDRTWKMAEVAKQWRYENAPPATPSAEVNQELEAIKEALDEHFD